MYRRGRLERCRAPEALNIETLSSSGHLEEQITVSPSPPPVFRVFSRSGRHSCQVGEGLIWRERDSLPIAFGPISLGQDPRVRSAKCEGLSQVPEPTRKPILQVIPSKRSQKPAIADANPSPAAQQAGSSPAHRPRSGHASFPRFWTIGKDRRDPTRDHTGFSGRSTGAQGCYLPEVADRTGGNRRDVQLSPPSSFG